MKLERVTKIDTRNTATSKRFDDEVVSAHFNVIVIFPIYGWFGAIRNSASERIVYDSYIFINTNLLS